MRLDHFNIAAPPDLIEACRDSPGMTQWFFAGPAGTGLGLNFFNES